MIPGLTDNANIARSLTLAPRQTVDGAAIADLLTQSAPCIPPTVDVTPLTASVARAQADPDRMSAMGLGSFLKGLWKTFQDVLKVVKDITAVVLYGDVVDILKLLVDGYQLYTDAKNTFLVAKGPHGEEKKFMPVKVYKEPVEKPCGGRTGRICPKMVSWE